MGIIDTIKHQFRHGGTLTQLIIINAGVFVVLRVLMAVGMLLQVPALAQCFQWVAMPCSPAALAHKPWTALTHLVTHVELWHVFANMLLLYWMGQLFLRYFTPKQLGGLYILGGLGGAALGVALSNVLPLLRGSETILLGASGCVMAIVLAITIYAPSLRLRLWLIGDVELRWVTAVIVVLDLVSMADGNFVGHFAHLGGAAIGVWFAMAMKQGKDITAWLNSLIDKTVGLFSGRKPKLKRPKPQQRSQKAATSGNNSNNSGGTTHGQPTDDELNAVLDKLKKSGYTALSEHDKDILYRASRRR